MTDDYANLTFTILWDRAGVTHTVDPRSWLSEYFESYKDVRFCDLDDGALVQAIYQDIFREYVAPILVGRVFAFPNGGWTLDGENFAALSYLDSSFWAKHAELRTPVLGAYSRLNREELRQDEMSRIEKVLASVRKSVASASAMCPNPGTES